MNEVSRETESAGPRHSQEFGQPMPADDPDHSEESGVMHLLDEHLPLSLLVDLTDPQGPRSEEILEAEGAPDEPWWER